MPTLLRLLLLLLLLVVVAATAIAVAFVAAPASAATATATAARDAALSLPYDAEHVIRADPRSARGIIRSAVMVARATAQPVEAGTDVIVEDHHQPNRTTRQ